MVQPTYPSDSPSSVRMPRAIVSSSSLASGLDFSICPATFKQQALICSRRARVSGTCLRWLVLRRADRFLGAAASDLLEVDTKIELISYMGATSTTRSRRTLWWGSGSAEKVWMARASAEVAKTNGYSLS